MKTRYFYNYNGGGVQNPLKKTGRNLKSQKSRNNYFYLFKMRTFNVTFTQLYAQEYTVTIQVNSDLTPEELESEMANLANDWRLPRLSEEEVAACGIQGYVDGSFSIWEGESEPESDVSTSVE